MPSWRLQDVRMQHTKDELLAYSVWFTYNVHIQEKDFARTC